jgi:ureidoglycolate hydrolase
MTRIIHAEPLSVAAYAPYGGMISTDVVTERTITVNGGKSRRTPEVVPTENLYAVNTASKIPARTVLNASLASPRAEVTAWSDDGATEGDRKGKCAFKTKTLERHRYSAQSFIPICSGVKYLVVVTDVTTDDKPDLDKLKAFVAIDKQGVCYKTGVWHASMSVVGDEVSF